MVSRWKKIDNKCMICKREVAKIKLDNGKVEVLEDYLMGSFVKVKGKGELRMICRNCQRDLAKKGKNLKDL